MPNLHSLAAALLFCSVAVQAAPYTPATDDTVLATVPTRIDPEVQALRTLRKALSTNPGDLSAAVLYAQAAIKLGHARSDPRYYGYAEAALLPWWNQADAPQPVLLLRATIRQFFHLFDQAGTDLDFALARHPQDDQARLIRAIVRQVQGHPNLALADCEQLSRQIDPLIATACSASASSLMGKAQRAEQLIGFVLDQSSPMPSEARLWNQTLQAEIAERLGRKADAAAAYQRALQTMDQLSLTDAYLLADWADFSIKQGQGNAVIDRLKNLTDIDNLLLRLALAEQAIGHRADTLALHKQMLEARFAAARQRGDAVHLREEAMYYLDLAADPANALRLAQQNWKTQREPIDALILLRAAKLAHQVDAAAPVQDWMRETGIEDQRLTLLIGALK